MQQINLYRYLPQPVKSLLDARALLVLFAVFCCMLFLSSALEIMEMHRDKSKLNAALDQYRASQQRLFMLASKYPYSIIQMQPPDEAKIVYCQFNFSKVLTALGEAMVPGVWLTDIVIDDHGSSMTLTGHALVEGQVQVYAEQLNKLPLFKKTPFKLLDVARVSAKEQKKLIDIVNFRLSTKPDEDHG